MTPELITRFIDFCSVEKSLSQNTLMAYRQDLLDTYKRVPNAHTSFDLSAEDILSYLRWMREIAGLSASTVRRRVVTLRAFLKWMVDTNRLASSPFDELQLDLKVPRKLPRPVDRPTLSHLFRETRRIAPTSFDPDRPSHFGRLGSEVVTSLLVRVLISTGVRIGEATWLRIADVSSGGASMRVRGKGDRERTVYISNAGLLSDLGCYIEARRASAEPEDYLFINSRNGRLTEAAFRKRLRGLSSELSIFPHLTPHRFRHSAATLLIEEGVDIRLVQRLLGHASIATTEIYTRVSDTSLISAIKAADTLAKVDF